MSNHPLLTPLNIGNQTIAQRLFAVKESLIKPTFVTATIGYGATVIGVSRDPIEKLNQFSVQECRNKFAVAADPDGSIMKNYDAILKLKPELAEVTMRPENTIELAGDANFSLYVPPGFAHGFLTLTDDVEMYYNITEVYAAELADGVRWNDPAFGITWPEAIKLISQRDRDFKDFA